MVIKVLHMVSLDMRWHMGLLAGEVIALVMVKCPFNYVYVFVILVRP